MPPVPPRLIVYVPLMHVELLPPGLPEGLSVLWPGLSASRPVPRDSRVAVWRPDMPYAPTEAEACLADFEALGRDMLGGSPVRAAGALRGAARPGVAPEEAAALAHFAGQGGRLPGVSDLSGFPDLSDREEAKRRAQRLLLLAWLQEERVSEMSALVRRYHAGSSALARELCREETGGTAPDESTGARPGARGLLPEAERMDFDSAEPIARELEDVRDLLPPWRFVLEQVACFLPEDAALFTADPRLLREVVLREGELGPACGESTAAWPLLRLWGEAVCRRLHVGRAPLWRLLGYSGPREGKPWLDEPRFVLMYRGEHQ